MSKNNENFGKGDIRGVIAPEAANNAKDGGALIPTLAFGIPGSAEMALFLGVLVLHGMDPSGFCHNRSAVAAVPLES